MSVSKTRQKLVDVARQLFAKNGIANTTMNDIAVASGKGRRTLYTYFSMIKETVVRNGNLRAEFFRNIWMVEKARKNFDEDEIEILRRIYAEGREDGEFDIDNIDLVADITHYCIKGLEVPFIYGRLGHGMNVESSKPLVAKVVYGALGKSGLKL